MTLQELEKTVSELGPAQLATFREWFFAFDASQWDQKLESDVAADRLDGIADEAKHQHEAGKSTDL